MRVQNTLFHYVWPKFKSGITQFNVFIRGSTDAYLILSPINVGITDDAPEDTGITKIVIGGWLNTMSGVVCNSHADWARYPSPGILDPNELREFHVSFAGGVIEISLAGEEPFMRHTMGCSHDINYIGITSGYGADADWKYCAGKLMFVYL